MKATCPVDPTHNRFITTATVQEDWLVTATGDYIETKASVQTLRGPDPDNTWECAVCGAAAVIDPYAKGAPADAVLVDALPVASPAHELSIPGIEENTARARAAFRAILDLGVNHREIDNLIKTFTDSVIEAGRLGAYLDRLKERI